MIIKNKKGGSVVVKPNLRLYINMSRMAKRNSTTYNNILSKALFKCFIPNSTNISPEEIEESAHLLLEELRETTELNLKYILFFLMVDKGKYPIGTIERIVFEKAIELIEDIRRDGELE